MAYVAHRYDVRDEGGDLLVRARWTGTRADPVWLVYDGSGDSCGAVRRDATASYSSWFHKKQIGESQTDCRSAISLLLDPEDRAVFEGDKKEKVNGR